jgi:hypothetical protein
MQDDRVIEAKVAQLFRCYPWRGAITVDEAITDAIAYRKALSGPDRQFYDAQILSGRHPSKALEATEIQSGRDLPQSGEAVRDPVGHGVN